MLELEGVVGGLLHRVGPGQRARAKVRILRQRIADLDFARLLRARLGGKRQGGGGEGQAGTAGESHVGLRVGDAMLRGLAGARACGR
ncbi:hypothetical protein D3C86_1874060 [compost metagenome]